MCVCVCAYTGFPSFKLDFSNGDQGRYIQGTNWAQVAGVHISDRRSYERSEGAWKTVVSWACELSTARVGVLGSQLFRNARNTETGFSDIISIAFITAWQSFI